MERSSRRPYRAGIFPVTINAVPAGPAVSLIAGPVRLCGWSLTSGTTLSSGDSASASFAAAGAGSAALPSNTDSLTGFTVDMLPVAAVVSGTVTVSNVTGGPLTYDFTGITTGLAVLSVNLAVPLPASAGAPTVAISAIVGGAAGHINVYGQTRGGLRANASFLDGGQVIGESNLAQGVSDTQWLTDEGIDIATGVSILVANGTINGAIFVRDRRRPQEAI